MNHGNARGTGFGSAGIRHFITNQPLGRPLPTPLQHHRRVIGDCHFAGTGKRIIVCHGSGIASNVPQG
jgi:hypothetical protein